MSDRLDPRIRRRRGLAVVATTWLALLGLGLGAVRGSSPTAGITVLCSSIEDLCQEWAREFTVRTGVPVATVRMSSGEALARIRRGDGEFDVWHGGTSDLYEVARGEGLLQPGTVARGLPAHLRAPDGSWTGVYRGVLGFCSNTTVLDRLGVPVPRSWDDLLDPRLAGMVSVPDPQTSGTGYTVLWTQLERTGSEQAALDYLVSLDRNVLQYTTSGIAPAGIAARGEAAVGVAFTQHCVKAIDEGVGHLRVSYPGDTTGMELGAVAELVGTRHPEQARRYVDFAISADAQRLGTTTRSVQLPARSDITPDARLAVPRGLRIVLTDARAASRRAELTAAFVEAVHA